MRRRYTNLVAMFFLITILVSCSNSQPSESTSVSNIPENREILTFAYVDSSVDSSCYSSEIESFNESQDVFFIQEVNYMPKEGEDLLSPEEKLWNELTSNSGPDMIDLMSFNIDVRDQVFQPYLEDLYPYIDSDPELSREDFIPTVINAYEVDGALYSTFSSLTINTVAVSNSVAKNGCWDIGMLSDTTASIAGIDNLSYVMMNSEVLFCHLIETFIFDFIDTETGYVNFESNAYRNLLESCSQLTARTYSGAEINDRGVLYSDHIRSFYYPQFYETIFRDEFVFASRLDHSVASYWDGPFDQLAMNRASKHKEGAWQFLRIFMTEDHQKLCSTFPSNLDALSYQIENARQGMFEIKIASALIGTQITRDYTPITSFDSSDVVYGPVSDEDIQRILDLINSTTRFCSDAANQCIEIAREIAQQYFEGTIDLDSAISMTQEKILSALK